MIRRRLSLPLGLLLVFLTPLALGAQSKTLVHPEWNALMGALEAQINKTPEPLLQERFFLVKSLLQKQKLYLHLDESLPKSFFGGVGFACSLSDPPQVPLLKVHPEFFNHAKAHPTLAMSVLIHEFQHVWDFSHQPAAYMGGFTNPLEKYFFEMDAYHMEGLFIQKAFLDQKQPVTRFEERLAESLRSDNLRRFSLVLLGVNSAQVYSYSADPKKKDWAQFQDYLVAEVQEGLKDLEDQGGKSPWVKYQILVVLSGLHRFGYQLLWDSYVLSHPEAQVLPDDQLKALFPGFTQAWNQLTQVLDRENTFVTQYMKDSRDQLDPLIPSS